MVECKHRHILEISRALKFEANLPIKFWGECVLTTTYIINRFPSKVIEYKTPQEILFGQNPIYDHMKVFGCLVYTRNIDTKGDKFEMMGRPGVFIGYPQGKKGYRIYDIRDKKIKPLQMLNSLKIASLLPTQIWRRTILKKVKWSSRQSNSRRQ